MTTSRSATGAAYHLHLQQHIGELPCAALYCAAAGCGWNHQLETSHLVETTAGAVETAVRVWLAHVEGAHPEALGAAAPSPTRRVAGG